MLRKIFYFFFAVCLISCSENQEPGPRPFARVNTLTVEEINADGALLTGEITLGTEAVTDHGFVLSQHAQFYSTSSVIYSIGPVSTPGKFQLRVDTELAEGVKYYVKAFAKTADFTSYGAAKEFVSLGSKGPQLSSIAPSQAVWGDPVVLRGTNFSSVKSNVMVKFDDIAATVVSASADSIVCRVPHELSVSPATIQVSVFGNSTEIRNAFSLLPPVIESVDPAQGSAGTLVTVKGRNFSVNTTQVTLGDIAVTLKQISPTSLAFEVPEAIKSGPIRITIVTADGNGSAEAEFTAVMPSVTNVTPLSGTYGDVITISVENWLFDRQTFLIFGPYELSPFEQTPSTFSFRVPESTDSYQYELQVRLGTMIIPTGKIFTLTPHEIFSVEPTVVLSRNLTVFGKGFSTWHIDVQVDGSSAYIYSNDHETIQVVVPETESHLATVSVLSSGRTVEAPGKIKIPFVRLPAGGLSTPAYGSTFSIGDELFVAGGDFSNHHLYRFDRTNLNWNYAGTLPFTPGGDDFSFAIGATAYYYSSNAKTFWAYNASSGLIQLNDVPFDVLWPSTYAINGSGYVIGGYDPDLNRVKKVWKYNPSNDTWLERSAAPTDLWERSGFAMNDVCYAFSADGHLSVYDPQSDQWTISSQVFDLTTKEFVGYNKGSIYFYRRWEGLTKYSFETSSYSNYDDQGFLQEVLSQTRFDTGTFLYFLDSAGLLWEFDGDFLE